jgi:hypothetical protein
VRKTTYRTAGALQGAEKTGELPLERWNCLGRGRPTGVVRVARRTLEFELGRLEEQRARYLLAAQTCGSKGLALRRLLTVERLGDHIASLQQALAAFDDRTAPIGIPPRTTGLGPVIPPAF